MPTRGAICEDIRSDLYLRGVGTSQAAAVVAGAAAVLLEQRPELTPDQVKYLLTSTAIDVGHKVEVQGHGLIDLAAAVEAPTPGPEAVQVHEPTTGLRYARSRPGQLLTSAPRATSSTAR